MNRPPNKKDALRCLALAAAAAVCLCILTRLMVPKRNEYGATWSAYLAEPRDSADVLFVGTSLVYCDVNPTAIEAASGISALDVSAPVLTMPQTYWYVREALRTQSPQVLMLEVTSLYAQPKDGYARICVGYMPFGFNKLACIFDAAPKSLRLELLFPLLKYHVRWSSLTAEDWTETFGPQQTDDVKGYTSLTDVWTPDTAEKTLSEPYTADYDRNLAYLTRIYNYCADRGVTVVFYYSPRWDVYPADAMDKLWTDIGQACPGALCIDFNSDTDAMGLDWSSDLYDDLHLNAQGAEKFSVYLGAWLADNFSLK